MVFENIKSMQSVPYGCVVTCIVFVLLVLTSCKPEERKEVLKDSYLIQMGDITFDIPVDYLVDARDRIDASEVKKIEVPPNNRDGRYEPHKYVILMGLLPDVTNFENGRNFIRSPDRTSQTVEFDMSYNKGGAYKGIGNLIESADENSTVILPNFKSTQDGLVKIGYNEIPREDLYIYVRSKKPISYLRCGRRPEAVNPHCWVHAAYNDSINLNIIFSAENLEWYGSQGGLDKIIARLDSWRIKSTPSIQLDKVK